MKRVKRIFCIMAAMVLLLTGSQQARFAGAEEAAATPTVTAADSPTPSAPTESTPAPPAEPTTTPESEPSTTPEDSSEPTAEPSATPTVEPSTEPSTSPSVEPSTEPTPAPQVVVAVEGEAQLQGDTALLQPQQTLTFTWTCTFEAASYVVYTLNAEGARTELGEITAARIELSAMDYATGRFTIYVGARPVDGADEDIVWGSLHFELASGQGGMGGKGGFGGFGGYSGSFSASGLSGDMSGMVEQGFTITPGVALTDSHSAGTKDMTPFGAVALALTGGSMEKLELGGSTLEIGLGTAGETFSAALDGDVLCLAADTSANEWTLDGFALKTLFKSGVSALMLTSGEDFVTIPTMTALTGEVYAALCAQGYVSKDYHYSVLLGVETAEIRVTVAGAAYLLGANGELIAVAA